MVASMSTFQKSNTLASAKSAASKFMELKKMISVKEAATLLKISERRVRVLCAENRIKGAKKIGPTWVLPGKPVISPAPRTLRMTKGVKE